MQVQLSYYSSQGNREINEDSVSVLEFGNSVLAMVADGLGGHGSGDAASRCVVASMNSALQNVPVSEAALCSAIREANEKVRAMQRDGIKMQTTLAVLWFNREIAVTANIGDSRIYQFRGGELVFQTVDHSVAQLAVLVGEITPEQIRHYQGRSRLVRAVGMTGDLQIDTRIINLQKGDCFLLCSDGFWDNITENEMCYYLQHSESPKHWLRQMRDYVEACGAKDMDNHSAIVIGYE